MATITIIGATLITAIAIGETYRLTALGQGPPHMLRPFFPLSRQIISAQAPLT
jgi:hypothetical protein